MNELVTISIENRVADVRFNRPGKCDAQNQDMVAAMSNTINSLAKDSTIRAVVISGEGKGFCAGLDFETFAGGCFCKLC